MPQGRAYVLLLALALLTGLGVRASVAYLADRTAEKKNEFTYGRVTSSVNETFEEEFGDPVKRNVSLRNTGNTPAYLRALLVVTWKDENGVVLSTLPVEDEDYEIDVTLAKHWILKDEGFGSYIYYRYPVDPGESTSELIDMVRQNTHATAPENGTYKLSVEIVVDAVQAYPADAVKEAWNVDVNEDGTLEVPGGVVYE